MEIQKQDDEQPQFDFNICVCGPTHVGKTSLINRIINNTFYPDYNPTVSLQYYRLVYELQKHQQGGSKDSNYRQIQIIDTFPIDHPALTDLTQTSSLMNDFRMILSNYVDGGQNAQNANLSSQKIDCYIFVYDSSERDTFDQLTKIIELVQKYEQAQNKGLVKQENPETHKVVIGNKLDLKLKKQVLTKEDKLKINGIKRIDISTMTNQSVSECFKDIVAQLETRRKPMRYKNAATLQPSQSKNFLVQNQKLGGIRDLQKLPAYGDENTWSIWPFSKKVEYHKNTDQGQQSEQAVETESNVPDDEDSKQYKYRVKQEFMRAEDDTLKKKDQTLGQQTDTPEQESNCILF